MSAVGDAPELQLDAPREEVLQRAVSLISQAWNSFDQARPGQPTVDEDLRAVLREPLPDTPEPVTRALDEAAQILDESIAQPRPRYFAFVGSSGLPIGVVADALASCFDANMAVYAGAASATSRSRPCAGWAELIGYPVGGGAFTSGGTISNLTALAAARERALPGARADGHGRPAGGGLLLGRGPLLGDARGRAARHRRRERAAARPRRRPPDGAGRSWPRRSTATAPRASRRSP